MPASTPAGVPASVMGRAQEALAVALGAKHGEDLSADPKRVAADRAVDDAVRAYYDFLSAMARLPEPIQCRGVRAGSSK